MKYIKSRKSGAAAYTGSSTTRIFRNGAPYAVVPVLKDMEERFGFVEALENGTPVTYVLLHLPRPVVLEDGTSRYGAYAIQEMTDACIPFGEVALLIWNTVLDFENSHVPTRVIKMSEFLGLGQKPSVAAAGNTLSFNVNNGQRLELVQRKHDGKTYIVISDSRQLRGCITGHEDCIFPEDFVSLVNYCRLFKREGKQII